MSTGTIRTLNPGLIDINPDEGGGEISFTEVPPSNVVEGSYVEFDIDQSNPRSPVAINIKLKQTSDPDLPADEGDVKTADIAGDLSINGNTVTLKGVTVSGKVEMKGGKLILKPNDANKRSKIIGSLDGKDNHRIVIYKSDVGGNLDFKNGVSLAVTEGTLKNIDFKNSQEVSLRKSTVGSLDGKDNMRVIISDTTVNGSVDVKNNTDTVSVANGKVTGSLDGKNNMKISINGTTVEGSAELKNNSIASVTSCIIKGDLVLKDNANCTSTGNIVTGENKGCQQ